MDEKLMTNPYYAKAIEYIKSNDLNALENGKHLIDGEDLFVNIVDSNMKTPQQARLEVHDKYIDIQIPLSKGETFGVKPRSECTQPDGEMNTDNCITFCTFLKGTFLLITSFILLLRLLSRGKHWYHFVIYPYTVDMDPSKLRNYFFRV